MHRDDLIYIATPPPFVRPILLKKKIIREVNFRAGDFGGKPDL